LLDSAPPPSAARGGSPSERRSALQALTDGLHAAFHRPETRIHQVVSVVVWALILGSIGLFLAEIWFGFQFADDPRFWLVDASILVTFAVELTLRVLTYRPPELDLFTCGPARRMRLHVTARLVFLLEPLNLIDLFTVLALVPQLRGLRALRLLRVLRQLRFFKYGNPFYRIGRGFVENRLAFYFAFSMLGLEVLIGGLSMYLVEARANPQLERLSDGFWWALVTITTVGFGDITPVTQLGRAVGAVLMVGGMFTLALFAGIVGHTFLKILLTLRDEQYRMATFSNHVVVCGFNPGARAFLDELQLEVAPETDLVLLADGERHPLVPPEYHWVAGDPTKQSELAKVRLTHAYAVVVLANRALPPQQADAITLMTAFTIRAYLAAHGEHYPRTRPVHIVTEILERENVAHARTAGADEVIESTHLGFSIMAHAVTVPGSAAVMSRVATAGILNLYVGQAPAEVQGTHSFGDLARTLKRDHDVILIGVHAAGQASARLNPPDGFLVEPGMQLVYLAQQPVLPR
jgi:voltage-gated potassium channel